MRRLSQLVVSHQDMPPPPHVDSSAASTGSNGGSTSNSAPPPTTTASSASASCKRAPGLHVSLSSSPPASAAAAHTSASVPTLQDAPAHMRNPDPPTRATQADAPQPLLAPSPARSLDWDEPAIGAAPVELDLSVTTATGANLSSVSVSLPAGVPPPTPPRRAATAVAPPHVPTQPVAPVAPVVAGQAAVPDAAASHHAFHPVDASTTTAGVAVWPSCGAATPNTNTNTNTNTGHPQGPQRTNSGSGPLSEPEPEPQPQPALEQGLQALPRGAAVAAVASLDAGTSATTAVAAASAPYDTAEHSTPPQHATGGSYPPAHAEKLGAGGTGGALSQVHARKNYLEARIFHSMMSGTPPPHVAAREQGGVPSGNHEGEPSAVVGSRTPSRDRTYLSTASSAPRSAGGRGRSHRRRHHHHRHPLHISGLDALADDAATGGGGGGGGTVGTVAPHNRPGDSDSVRGAIHALQAANNVRQDAESSTMQGEANS